MSRLHWALLGLAVAARLFYGWARPPQPHGAPLAHPDDYATIASAFADSWTLKGSDGKVTAWREPGYPVYLGLGFKLLGKNYAAVLVVNTLAQALGIGLLFLCGRRLFGERAATLAMAIAALYPPFIFYNAQAMRQSLLVFFGVAGVWSLLESLERPRWVWLSGIINALGALTDTTLLPFGLILAPLLLLAWDFKCGWQWRRAGLFLSALIPLYALWPIRNYIHFQRFVFGNTCGAGGNFYEYLVVPQELGGLAEHQEIIKNDSVFQNSGGLDPIEREKYFWKAGLNWVGEHPLGYLRIWAWRFFVDFWRLWPRPRSYGSGHSYGQVRLVGMLSDGWIIPLGLLGAVLGLRRKKESIVPLLFVASVAFTFSLIFTMLRYRIPVMTWIILFAALAAERAAVRIAKISLR